MSKIKANISIKIRPDFKKSSKSNSGTNLLSELGRATKRGIKKCPNCGFINGNRSFMCKNSFCGKIFKASDKRKLQLDSVKIETGTSRQIYSVRVQEDLPDERGFVQLPILEEGKKNRLLKVALCFVESCQRLFADTILKCHEIQEDELAGPASVICCHIESALKSISNASSLEFKHELISGLKANDEMKKKLCLLAKSTDGPLVQKVGFNVFAVKCLVSPNHPLGFLHFKVFSNKEGGDDFDCFSCSCTDLIINYDDNNKKEKSTFKCEHFYAALCAFCSDNRFSYRFSNIIQNEFHQMYLPSFEFNFVNLLEQENDDHVLQSKNNSNVEIKILSQDFLLEKKLPPKKSSNEKIIKSSGFDEKHCVGKYLYKSVSLDFNLWLSSVTESINNACKSENSITSKVLTFHIPNSFFNSLQSLLSKTSSLQKIETITKDCLTEEKYLLESWHITHVTDLYTIFNTNLIKLNNFHNDLSKHLQTKNVPLVTIEWIENIYKITKFGELKILLNNT